MKATGNDKRLLEGGPSWPLLGDRRFGGRLECLTRSSCFENKAKPCPWQNDKNDVVSGTFASDHDDSMGGIGDDCAVKVDVDQEQAK